MAAEISRVTGVEADLIKGAGGIFDVVVDGTKIFSKFDTYRFPRDGEVAELLKK
ncbi:MAG TPA: hypothetical protein PLN69_05245 [bacterium]|nr:hypothetical protein [bacterium]